MQLFIRTIKSEKFLFFLLIISFSLRIYGLNWGIPEPSSEWPLMSYHPDESRILLASSQFPIHIFTSKEFLYPTGLQYFIGILTLPIRLLILLFAGKDGIEMFFPNMLIIGRIFSVICGTLTIFFTYLIGNEIFHKKVGLYASIFLTFYIYHVSHSAFAHLDIPHSLFIALFIFLPKVLSSSSKLPLKDFTVSIFIIV